MHDLMKLPTNAPVPTKLTCGIACPDRVFMVRDLPSKDAVGIAYGQHTCIEPIPEMHEITWHEDPRVALAPPASARSRT